ncbi:cyclic nucleotide-binding domain-containing protein [Ancylobacter sp. MQZ15Z-1]|uniref:Cyclic nucleotide-binding domain-containing protein n=1 Tax=Ancylobacter mangrovi TaxID=2972472 RepID=A0A9X2PAD2_9HYPH|nr:cyclic nucleotide-binding domain-containing protein [Ancylobacter mangrovi]MCS0495147.1 cyclic nucleotide-binding domain-containing protein [Ancylobacter mangrovi]
MSIEDDIALLDRVPLLRLLGKDVLRVLAISSDTRPLAEGEILFREGQFAEAAYVVAKGRLRLNREDPALARRPGQKAEAGPGSLLGEMALITETKRPATATAIEESVVIRIPRVFFLRTIEGYPDAAVRIGRELSGRVRDTLGELDVVRAKIEALDTPPRR